MMGEEITREEKQPEIHYKTMLYIGWTIPC